jgi:flagellar biogenesis protein FliO
VLACLLASVETASAERSLWLDYAKTLLILTGICFIAMFAIRVLLPKITGVNVPTSSSHLEVIARHLLEPRKTLYLVRAGKSLILLASSGDNLQFMTALEPQDVTTSDVPAAAGNGSALRNSSALKETAQRMIGLGKERL